MKNRKLERVERKLELEKDKLKEQEYSRSRSIFYILIFLVLLFFATFGITVSLYKGQESVVPDDNTIVTDKIVFTYSDVDKGGNGIYLKNAIAISDNQGKAMIGKGEYFDFSITATSKTANIKYKVLARKDSASTLPNGDVRIYLASISGDYEKELLLNTFSSLKQERIDGVDYYVLYEKTLDKNIDNYSDFYRLKMWVKEDAKDYEEKTFMLKVDVIAEQVGD